MPLPWLYNTLLRATGCPRGVAGPERSGDADIHRGSYQPGSQVADAIPRAAHVARAEEDIGEDFLRL